MNEQQKAIRESGLSMKDLERLTGMKYSKIERVRKGETEFKISELESILIVNKYIAIIKSECGTA